MNIGFDAKRYFHNNTGLGNYSRTLIEGLSHFYPEHQYFLFNPKAALQYQKLASPNVHEILPEGFIHKKLPAAWRSSWVKKDLKRLAIDIYHGLSHEIPLGIEETNIRSVVTIHDLIFERYPEQFSKIDVRIYHKKFTYSCKHADRVIAISQQTKQDIIEWYGTPEEKIDICYQSCHPSFSVPVDEEVKETIRKRYQLPAQFFLSVGSVIERKNLLNVCRAMYINRHRLALPLIVIGDGGKYKEEVKDYIRNHKLEDRVIFLSEQNHIRKDRQFQLPETFAAIYQMATAMLYPSFFEGFGIPVLEALWSRLPVITSNVSCLPETGGDGAYYINPASAEEIGEAMWRIASDPSLAASLMEKGWAHAQNFTLKKCTDSLMSVYQKLMNERAI